MNDKIFEDLFDLVDEFEAKTIEELIAEYEELQEEIAFWLTMFSSKGKLEWVEMRQYLTPIQLRRLKQYVGDDIEDRVRVKRIDAINLILEKKLEELADSYAEKIKQFSTEIYEETYRSVAKELEKDLPSNWVLPTLVLGDILKKILIPWTPDEINFMHRIRINCNKLLAILKKTITEEILASEENDAIKNSLEKRVKTLVNSMRMVINTEITRVITLGVIDVMKQYGIDSYEYCAILDNRTSEQCRFMNGKQFKLSELEIGVNAPPLHVHCRSYIKPIKNK